MSIQHINKFYEKQETEKEVWQLLFKNMKNCEILSIKIEQESGVTDI